MDSVLKTALETYLTQEFRPCAIQKVKELLENPGDVAQLKSQFCQRLQFGTAGLRGPMKDVGLNCMNVLTILQTSQGIAHYLEDREKSNNLHIVVGYDGRHNSKEFAEFASAAFLARGFKVSLFGSSKGDEKTPTPTPFTPYYLIKSGADFGVQVTASHNPAQDNGYKVYDKNGAQIIPPVDGDIASYIEKNLKPWESIAAIKKHKENIVAHPRLSDPYDEVMKTYFEDIKSDLLATEVPENDLKIVYTAMHGVGSIAVHKMCTEAGFSSNNFFSVPEQDKPDPDFPTVSFPNPEEKGALDMAMAHADKHGAALVFANDPDADRFAFCEKLSDGSWHQYHGDEIGVLCANFVLDAAIAKQGLDPKKCLLACSAVSSGMMKKVIQARGGNVIETLTGFKWIINDGQRVAKEKGLNFIFGYEEALGFACDMRCPDKDGVSALGLMLQQARKLYAAGKSFHETLMDYRRTHGFFISNNGYVICKDPVSINEIFTRFRSDGKYVTSVGPYKVNRIRDVTTGFDNAEADNKCALPTTPGANMITLYFDFGHVTIRTSGTEPKLKWYSEGCSSDPEQIKNTLSDLVTHIISDIFHANDYPVENIPPEYKK